MHRLVTLLTAVVVAIVVAGCGGSDQPKAVTPAAQPDTGSGSAATAAETSPVTCAQLRIERLDYQELYRELGCRNERRALCQGVPRSDPRFVAYQCKVPHRTAAQRRAIKRRAHQRKVAAARRADERKATAKRARAEAKKAASKAKSASRNSSTSSSSNSPSSSSSSASGPSRSSSSGSSGSRRR